MIVETSSLHGEDTAAERGHGPDEALELKMSKNAIIFINVRFAGHACCWTDNVKSRPAWPDCLIG